MSDMSEYAKCESECVCDISDMSEYAKCESECMGDMSDMSEYAKCERQIERVRETDRVRE